MRWCWKGDLENNRLSHWIYNGIVRKTTYNNPNSLGIYLDQLENLTVNLVGTNIEKCDMTFVTETVSSPCL